jgi:chromosome segregation ATPase
MRTPSIPLAALALVLFAAPVAAADFHDRDALAATLTLDEQAPLADAEESLAVAESALADAEVIRDAAQVELDAANQVLSDAQATLDTANMDLGDARTALMDAEAAAAASAAAESQALMDLTTAQAARDQGIADGLPQPEIDLLEQAVVDAQLAFDSAATPKRLRRCP